MRLARERAATSIHRLAFQPARLKRIAFQNREYRREVSRFFDPLLMLTPPAGHMV
jgi:hypothetical protein